MRRLLFFTASFAALAATAALAQATPETASFPQPHLDAARAEAFKENRWKYAPLTACYPDEGQVSQRIIKDPGPSRAADNLYFLGNGQVGVWAIDTRDGVILIDALNDQAEAERFIEGGMRQLGLDPARIRVILISHGHIDHYGGVRYLQDKYGARVYQSPVDQALAEAASRRPGARSPAPRPDMAVTDGQTVTLGETTITVYVTPGHTPGGLSMIIPVRDRGQVRTLAYFGGVNSKWLPPAEHRAYDASVRRFATVAAAAKAEGYIGNHPSFDDSFDNLERIKVMPREPNPFFRGPASVARFMTVLRECNLNNEAIEAAMPEAAATARARRAPGG